MNLDLKPGAPRAVFLSSASALPMLRGPAVTYSPEADAGTVAAEAAEVADLEIDDQPDEIPGDDGAAEPAEGEGEQPKPKKSAQDRIDELTRARREAERRAEAAERRAADAEKKAKPSDNKPAADPKAEPNPSKYQYGDTDPAYIRDLARYEARQAFAKESQDAETRAHHKALADAWEDRQIAFAQDKPDYFEKVEAADLPITPAMADAIRTSDEGAAVAYHLAENPDEARRIAALPIIAQVREIGRIEGKLAKPADNPGEQPDPLNLKPASKGPSPAPQLRGQGGQFKVSPETDDFSAFEKTYG